MRRFIKRSIDFTMPQMEKLRVKTEKLGISISEYVRRLVDKDNEDSQ